MMIQSAVENISSDLSATTIHLWTLSAEDIATIELPNTCLSWLGETERNRHDRLQLERNQNHFLVGQVFLRKVLSNYSATQPDEWSFVTNEYGKPQLSDVHADQQLHFNLSHSGQAYVVAVSRAENLGVDVEFSQRERRIARIAERHFSPKELAALLALPEDDQQERFYSLWTLKEAYIKARGMGLAIPLHKFGFDIGSVDPAQLNFWVDAALNDPVEEWQFWELEVLPNYAMALAVPKITGNEVSRLKVFATQDLETVADGEFAVLCSN